MKTTVSAALAVALIMSSLAPAQAGMAGLSKLEQVGPPQSQIIQIKKKKKSANIVKGLAAGVALGVIGAAVANGAANGGFNGGNSHAARCDRWLDRCEYGNERACYKFDTRC